MNERNRRRRGIRGGEVEVKERKRIEERKKR